ncbi:MAG TPA: hypothetical protein VFG39_01170, partial [Balneolaceae bacterium]|nr:hypothetical protein [Balneolaceae bacterium]
ETMAQKVADEDRTEEHRHRSGTRAMTEVRQLTLENFSGKNNKFFTLTFGDHGDWVKNVEECNKLFKKFIQKLRYRYGKDFKFLVVVEFQDKNERGAVHYHLLLDEKFPLVPVNRDKVRDLKEAGKLPEHYKEKENLEDIWSWGWVSIEKINHVRDMGKYLIKYMIKDFGDIRLEGKKNYWTSRNVDRPDKITDYNEAVEVIKRHELEKKETAFEVSYESEYVGTVILREYVLDC